MPPTCLAYTNASGRVMVVDIIFVPPKIEPEILKSVGKREHNHWQHVDVAREIIQGATVPWVLTEALWVRIVVCGLEQQFWVLEQQFGLLEQQVCGLEWHFIGYTNSFPSSSSMVLKSSSMGWSSNIWCWDSTSVGERRQPKLVFGNQNRLLMLPAASSRS